MSISLRAKIFLIASVCVATLGFAVQVYAESTVWSTTISETLLYAGQSDQCYGALDAPNVSVTYSATAVNAATGESICGTTIPKDTRVNFQFAPHTWQDIYWFGTGFNHGSPYGDWSQGAAPPTDSAQWCTPNNYVNSFGTYSDSILRRMTVNESHVPLRVAPPSHALSGTGLFECGAPAADGSRTCTAKTAGSATPSFDFGSTFGYFYFAIKYDPGLVAYWGSESCSVMSGRSPLRSSPSHRGYGPVACSNSSNFTLQVPIQQISCSITIAGNSDDDADDGDRPGSGNRSPGTPSLSGVGSCTVRSPYSVSMVATDPDNNQIRYGIDWDANGSIDQFVPPPDGYVSSGTTLTASRTYVTPGNKTVRVLAEDRNGLTSSWSTYSFSCAAPPRDNDAFIVSDTDDTDANNGIDLNIRAIPSLVRRGEKSRIHWSSSRMDTCTVSAPNGNIWENVLESPVDGEETSSIEQQTTYTLRCVDADNRTHTRDAIIDVLPVWQES